MGMDDCAISWGDHTQAHLFAIQMSFCHMSDRWLRNTQDTKSCWAILAHVTQTYYLKVQMSVV